MAANLVSATTVTGKITGANVVVSNSRIWMNPESLTSSGAMSPYRPSILTSSASGVFGMSLSPGSANYAYQTITYMTIDSNGNIYAVGTYQSNPTIYNLTGNPNTTSSGYNLPNNTSGVSWLFIIKWNSSGVYQSSAILQAGANAPSSQYVTCDSSNNVYFSGAYTGNPTMFNMTANPNTSGGSYALPNNTGSSRPFLIKYDSSGNYVFSTTINTFTNNGYGQGVAFDSSGNIYWAAQYNSFSTNTSTIYNLTANPNTSSAGYNFPNGAGYAIMVKYNSSGTYQSMTGIMSAGASGIGVHSSGDIYISGYYNTGSSTTIYNMAANPNSSSSGYSFPSNNNFTSFVIKYNSSGTYQYSVAGRSAGSNFSQVSDLRIDSGGNVYICGSYNDSSYTIYNMGTNPVGSSSGYSLPSSTNWNSYLIKYNSSGTYQYSTAISATGIISFAFGQALSIDSSNNVYWAISPGQSQTLYSLTLNPYSTSTGYTLPANSGTTAALIKYNSSGTYQGATSLIGGSSTAYGVAVNITTGAYYYGGTASAATSAILYNFTANPNSSSTGYSIPLNGFVIGYGTPVGTSLSMTLTNLGAGVTTVVEKPIFNLTGTAVTVTENSNTWTIPAASNLATAMWTIDRWSITSYTSPVLVLPLYTFTTATFNTGGATGQYGPTISQARSGLAGTPTPSAWSGTYLNMTTQGYQLWTVPATGTYTISIAGGKGYVGASGMITTGTFILTRGEVLTVLVGQEGNGNSGGGGGTFVVRSPYGIGNCLIVAGGGGGKWDGSGGGAATPGQTGTGGSCGACGTVSGGGGVNGGGGGGGTGGSGSGGGGFLGNGGIGTAGTYCCGAGAGGNGTDGFNGNCGGYSNAGSIGRSYTNGAIGGLRYDTGGSSFSSGGFGGGGGAITWNLSGGGGGGYSGGGGGGTNTGSGCTGGVHDGGGGGGSINNGTNQSFSAANNGTGYVTITKI